jgi:MarR family transcriptional regulator, organic hydroperoxide resistance regulator
VMISLTEAGRQLKAKAAKVPGCVVSATHCPVSELMALTQQVQALRRQLAA